LEERVEAVEDLRDHCGLVAGLDVRALELHLQRRQEFFVCAGEEFSEERLLPFLRRQSQCNKLTLKKVASLLAREDSGILMELKI